MDKAILKLEDIRKVYRPKASFFREGQRQVVALNGISLNLERGEVFGLVGESGSGKTTVGRLIVSLERPDAGRILLDGVDLTRLKGRSLKTYRRKVQMIFQDPYQSLNPQRTVLDTVAEPLAIHGLARGEARLERVAATLKAVGLSPPEDFFPRYPHRLSGGQRQRVAIARAMVLEPALVVADEPTSMLDASISAQIFNILLHMRENLGITLLFITHSLAAARYLCDRIGVIYRGNLVELAPAQELIRRPRHPYTQALIDALPRFGQSADHPVYGTLLQKERETARDAGCAFYPRCRVAIRSLCEGHHPALEQRAASHWVACFLGRKGPADPI